MKAFLFSLFIIVLFACGKSDRFRGSEIFFQIQIKASHDIDCGLPDIIFLSNQNEAYTIIGDNRGTYVAYGLPEINYQAGDKLWVRIRKPESNELSACHALGPSWSWVTITTFTGIHYDIWALRTAPSPDTKNKSKPELSKRLARYIIDLKQKGLKSHSIPFVLKRLVLSTALPA